MAARKSKLAASVQDLTIEMPREYLEHALCKQVNFFLRFGSLSILLSLW